MAKQTNGIMLKLTIGAMITLSLFTVGAVWRAAGYAKDVDNHTSEIKEIKPILHKTELSVVGIQKDIERILLTQKKMEEKNAEDTRLIIEAIQNGN